MTTTLATKTNALNWFEIYTADYARAKTFYETILEDKLEDVSADGVSMAVFPHDKEKGIGGSITQMEENKPGPGGTIVYLNVEGKLDAVLSRVANAGGKVLRPRFAIPPHGFIAIMQDSEGNVIGLHSMS